MNKLMPIALRSSYLGPRTFSRALCKLLILWDGRTRIRTLDPLIKSQLLYQLSYAPRQARALGGPRIAAAATA